MLSADADRDPLARVSGMLEAFAWVNGKADNGYTFSLEVLPKRSTVEESLKCYFQQPQCSVQLTIVEDWQAEVRDLLNRWLFQYLEGTSSRLVDAKRQFALSHPDSRESLLTELLDAFRAGLRPTRTWRVDVELGSFYECAWDDLALEEEGRIVLVHFGVSD